MKTIQDEAQTKMENINRMIETIKNESQRLADTKTMNWGHVGSLGRVEEDMKNLVDFLKGV